MIGIGWAELFILAIVLGLPIVVLIGIFVGVYLFARKPKS